MKDKSNRAMIIGGDKHQAGDKSKGNLSWREMDKAGIIRKTGNAKEYKTGEWRSMKPVWKKDICKQCGMCFPVCPDVSILVDKEGRVTGIDYDHCKGCGVCVEVCPFDAYDFVKE